MKKAATQAPKKMTDAQYKKYMDMSGTDLLADEKNPVFILQQIDSSLVRMIAKGELDMVDLAKRELANRGIDVNGKWIGFKS